jgi:cell division protein FtsB
VSARAAAATPRRHRLTGRAVVLAAVILALLAAGVVPLRQYFEQRAEIAALEQQVDTLLQERVALKQRIERFQDPAFLELLARKCLGMVKEGEIAFVSVPRGGEPRPPSC